VQPQWAPDPTHRHALRWWDGGRWTEHVADGAVQGGDPLDGGPYPGRVQAFRESVQPVAVPPGLTPPAPIAAGRRTVLTWPLHLLLVLFTCGLWLFALPGVLLLRRGARRGAGAWFAGVGGLLLLILVAGVIGRGQQGHSVTLADATSSATTSAGIVPPGTTSSTTIRTTTAPPPTITPATDLSVAAPRTTVATTRTAAVAATTTAATTTASTKPPTTKPPTTKPPTTKPVVTKPVVTRPVVIIPPTTKPPTTEPVATKPAGPIAGVHPGAFCSQHEALGTTADGTLMRCSTTATDTRYRWRKA
jgi:hypothetical protein